MSLNYLAQSTAIQTALFCRIDLEFNNVLRFSNYNIPLTVNGYLYTGIGQLMAVTETTNELRVSPNELTVTISGIPPENIVQVLSYKFKGSPIYVYRGLFNPTTGMLISGTPNPIGKFQGLINNFTLNEEWSGQDATNTISFVCTSTVGLLSNKISGRRTNPVDEKAWYPGDLSMDRVPTLANSNFNFGAVLK
jgi:hypothetical protein